MTATTRVGIGFDVHRFSVNAHRPLFLGGIHVGGHVGLEGHSDADVVCHAITDALLGAAVLGDMGEHFPDTNPSWKGADSITMLVAARHLLQREGWEVVNVDCTVVVEQPKIAPYRDRMQQRLTEALHAPVSVKAGRAEGLGALGRVEGAACWAVALIERSIANAENKVEDKDEDQETIA